MIYFHPVDNILMFFLSLIRVQEPILIITAREWRHLALGNMACQKDMFSCLFTWCQRDTLSSCVFSAIFCHGVLNNYPYLKWQLTLNTVEIFLCTWVLCFSGIWKACGIRIYLSKFLGVFKVWTHYKYGDLKVIRWSRKDYIIIPNYFLS